MMILFARCVEESEWINSTKTIVNKMYMYICVFGFFIVGNLWVK